MDKKDNIIDVKSNYFSLYIKFIGVIIIPSLLLSILVLGRYFQTFFIILLILSSVLYLVFIIFTYPWSYSKIDINNGELKKSLNWKIKLKDIKKINCTQLWSQYFITIGEKNIQKIVIGIAITKEDYSKMIKYINKDVDIKIKTIKTINLIVLLIFLVLIFYGINYYKLAKNNPIILKTPKTIIFSKEYSDKINTKRYENGIYSYIVPYDFQNMKGSKKGLYIENVDTSILINYNFYDIDYRKLQFFYNKMKIKNSYDMMNFLYNTKYPLFFVRYKSKFLTNYDNMEIFKHSNDDFSSFIIKIYDNKEDKYKYSIFMFNHKYNKEINIIISKKYSEISEEVLYLILNHTKIELLRKKNMIYDDTHLNIV
ncbi:MAG: hypothetical protein GX287_00590 [Fusobacteria bacterium]|nr:hypothetical protein [Fusobacteriota bacterium]